MTAHLNLRVFPAMFVSQNADAETGRSHHINGRLRKRGSMFAWNDNGLDDGKVAVHDGILQVTDARLGLLGLGIEDVGTIAVGAEVETELSFVVWRQTLSVGSSMAEV